MLTIPERTLVLSYDTSHVGHMLDVYFLFVCWVILIFPCVHISLKAHVVIQ
jgi:hypothetical protein